MSSVENISNTLFDQKSPVHQEIGSPGGDNIPTHRLNWPRGWVSENIWQCIVLTTNGGFWMVEKFILEGLLPKGSEF